MHVRVPGNMHTLAPLQVSYCGLQLLKKLPALTDLEVEEHMEKDDDDDDGHYYQQPDLDEEEFPSALDDLRDSFTSAGRSLTIKNNVDEWASFSADW